MICSSKLSEIVSEASKQSKDIAAEAIKSADQIKSQIPPDAVALLSLVDAAAETTVEPVDLERFGVTDELREFFKGITLNTFQDFPLQGNIKIKICVMPTCDERKEVLEDIFYAS